MRCDEKNRRLRLQLTNVCYHLKARNISKKEIDDAKTEAPLTRLVDAFETIVNQHDLVAVRLKHQLERIANGRLVINDQNTGLILCYDVGHILAVLQCLVATDVSGRSTLMPNFFSLR